MFVFALSEFYGKGKNRSNFPSPSDGGTSSQRTMIIDDGLADAVLIERSSFEIKME